MKLIGEVYSVTCPHCNNECQVVLKPNEHKQEPFMLSDAIQISGNMYDTSMFQCPDCNFSIQILGTLIFVVGDVEEFDEIEQHR